MSLKMIHHILLFWKSLRRLDIISECLVKFTIEAIWSWAFFCKGGFWLLTHSLYSLKDSSDCISPWFSPDRLYVWLPNFLTYNYSVSYDGFYFVSLLVVSVLLFVFIYLTLIPFFLVKSLSMLSLIISKIQLLFSLVFFYSIFCLFTSTLISFPSF